MSRLDMIYSACDQNLIFNRDFQKRLTGRFALPNAVNCIEVIVKYNDLIGVMRPKTQTQAGIDTMEFPGRLQV